MQNQLVNGLIADSKEMHHIFESFPGSVFCKDKAGTYLAVNRIQLSMNGNVNMLGKKDSDMHWIEQAPMLQQNDHQIIHSEKFRTFIEPSFMADKKLRTFLSYKFPLKSKSNKTIGIFGMAVLFDDSKLMNTWLFELGFLNPANLLTRNNKNLTRREMDCLYYVVRGMTMKQIAASMNLAPKTIEHYLEAIKKKLNCRLRSDLVSHALQIPYIRNQL